MDSMTVPRASGSERHALAAELLWGDGGDLPFSLGDADSDPHTAMIEAAVALHPEHDARWHDVHATLDSVAVAVPDRDMAGLLRQLSDLFDDHVRAEREVGWRAGLLVGSGVWTVTP